MACGNLLDSSEFLILLMIDVLHYLLRTLNSGNCGVRLIMGNAGCISSTALLVYPLFCRQRLVVGSVVSGVWRLRSRVWCPALRYGKFSTLGSLSRSRTLGGGLGFRIRGCGFRALRLIRRMQVKFWSMPPGRCCDIGTSTSLPSWYISAV